MQTEPQTVTLLTIPTLPEMIASATRRTPGHENLVRFKALRRACDGEGFDKLMACTLSPTVTLGPSCSGRPDGTFSVFINSLSRESGTGLSYNFTAYLPRPNGGGTHLSIYVRFDGQSLRGVAGNVRVMSSEG